MSIDYARIQYQDPSPFPSCLLRGESFTTHSFSCAHDIILLVSILTYMPISIHLVSRFLAPGNWARWARASSLSVRVSWVRVVCGLLPWAPPTSPHSCVWPSSTAPSHSLSPYPWQEQRRDTSPSSFDGRTPRASPSRTCGLDSFPPFPSTLRVRGTLSFSFNSSSSRNPVFTPPTKHLRRTTAALAR